MKTKHFVAWKPHCLKKFIKKNAESRITNRTWGLETPTRFGVQAPFPGRLEFKGLQAPTLQPGKILTLLHCEFVDERDRF